MKTNYEVCKEFAKGNKTSSRGNNIFFEEPFDGADRVLYSYGYHFPIALIDRAGRCFFTVRGYSNTTAKHINLADSALRGYEKIYCPVPGNNYDSFEWWHSNLQNLERKMCAARKPEIYGGEMSRIISQIRVYLAATGAARPGWLSKFVRVANSLQPTKKVLAAFKKARAAKHFAVYACADGAIISKHRTQAQAKKAIDKYNAAAGSFGRLDYDFKYIY